MSACERRPLERAISVVLGGTCGQHAGGPQSAIAVRSSGVRIQWAMGYWPHEPRAEIRPLVLLEISKASAP